MIDFKKLANIIPDKGSITLTIKKNPDGKLGILFRSKHSLLKPDMSYEKEVKDTQEAIEKASKDIDQTKAFTGSPESLTASFEEMISKQFETERSLTEVINESTVALNERIKELKDKKASKTAPKKLEAPKTEKKAEEKPESSSEMSLFGIVNTPETPKKAETACAAEACAEETTDNENESDVEDTETQEAA